jgi:hypothetical protein
MPYISGKDVRKFFAMTALATRRLPQNSGKNPRKFFAMTAHRDKERLPQKFWQRSPEILRNDSSEAYRECQRNSAEIFGNSSL